MKLMRTERGVHMAEANRVNAADVRAGVVDGSTLLVCAYDDDAKYKANNLDGAIPLSEFKSRVDDLSRETKIVFYCG